MLLAENVGAGYTFYCYVHVDRRLVFGLDSLDPLLVPSIVGSGVGRRLWR